MYIKGVGMTKFSVEDRNTQSMVIEATHEALDHADMNMNDIDAVVVSMMDSSANGERQKLFPSVLCSIFKKKMPALRSPAVCGGGGASLWTANRLGYDNVLVIGAEKLVAGTSGNVTDEILKAAERVYEQCEGIMFPAQNALAAQQYMQRYGATINDLSLVALKNHENAYMNPKARFYNKKVTIKMIKKSPVIASPLRLFDCSLNVNGVAACIVSKDKTDIKIKASQLCTDRIASFESPDMTRWDATSIAAKAAYKEAGLGPSDIDFAEIHDAFTSLELMAYEDLFFCKKGEGKKMIRDGITKLDGSLPVNSCGGLKAKGHPISATGLAQVYEITKQMLGEAGDRQLSKKNIALSQNVGGVGSTVAVHILEKVGG